MLSWLLLLGTGHPGDPAPFLAAFWLHDRVVVCVACVVLFTGLFFSFFTPWGLVRRWWMVAKWAGLALLGLGTPFLLTPGVAELAARSDLVLAVGAVDPGLAAVAWRVRLLLGGEALLLTLAVGGVAGALLDSTTLARAPEGGGRR